jgi:hypothetical protein
MSSFNVVLLSLIVDMLLLLVRHSGQCPFEEKYEILKNAGVAVMVVANTEHIAFPMPSMIKSFARRLNNVTTGW